MLARLLMLALAGAAALFAQEDPPFQLPSDVTVDRDVVYASPGGRDLHCDIYRPKASGAGRPVILFIHGGGWRNGSRDQFRRQAAHMASKGMVAATLEYRLSGEAQWPAAIDDCKAAVRFFWENQGRYGVDPRRVGVAGGSAGGHLAALMGTSNNRDSFGAHLEHPGPASDVAAVAAFNPALDLPALWEAGNENVRELLTAFLGKPYPDAPEVWKLASPINGVGLKSADFLILHGTADSTTPYAHAVAMVAKLKEADRYVELFTAEGAGHGFFNRPPWFEQTLEAMEKFFRERLREPRPEYK